LPCRPPCQHERSSGRRALHEQKFRRRGRINLLETEVAIQGHGSGVVTIDPQREALHTVFAHGLCTQGLHEQPAKAAPACQRGNNDAAQVRGTGVGHPVLAKAQALALPVQQRPAWAYRELKHLREPFLRQGERHAGARPALGGRGGIKPIGNGGVVGRLDGAKAWFHDPHGAPFVTIKHAAWRHLRFVIGQ